MQLNLFKNNRETRAQAMVEFAIVLPILLVLLFGIIEVGRIIFIFSSVANASRQAARYGAASGQINNVTYYQDCDGIREIHHRRSFEQTLVGHIQIGVYPCGCR